MTRVFENVSDWKAFRSTQAESLGFIPTMGALHPGHLELVRRSRSENERTLVSIFVNPTQFNDPKDLENYPRTFEADLLELRRAGVDYVLFPQSAEMYLDDYRYRVSEEGLSRELCGAHRPGHFDGVLTVVLKLLNLAQAKRAYFGEKDFQQLELVRGMVEAFFLQTEVVSCPTVREEDGLAMSSRNARLSEIDRELASHFPKILRDSMTAREAHAALEAAGFGVDYVEDRLGRRFGAVRLGEVRLIDNMSREAL
jgi:pantoate--beta-alanine ligase